MTNRWYAVHAYSNFENKVADSIREQAKQRGLSDLFEEILVPKEKVIEVRRGRKVDAERKFFPGYVLVKMQLTDEAYHLIKNTPKVTGFLGSDNKPMPLSEAEAQRILHQVQEGIERPKPSVSFEVGEQVRVSDGPFASFNGTVEEVDEGRSRLRRSLASLIFGPLLRRWNWNSARWRSFNGRRRTDDRGRTRNRHRLYPWRLSSVIRHPMWEVRRHASRQYPHH